MSQVRFAAETAPYAVLSRNDDFADSLAGAPLTGKGPMLLTSPDALAPATLDELLRVLPDGGTLYALGGPVAISEVVVGQLTAAGLRVTRLAGTSRVETAVRVAEQVRQFNPDSSWVALARSEGPADNPSAGWADSVTGGAWAAAFPTPVLVTPTDSLHPAVDAALRVWGPERTILFGGATALSDSVAAAVPNPQRVAGAERSGTAFEIAERLWGSTGRYLLINGYAADGWAYGLPAAGLAADLRAPLLLADQTSIPQPTLSRLGLGCGSGQPVVDVLVVGGRAALGEEIAVAADQQDGGACPQPDDYDLAVQLPLRRTGLFETCPPPPQSPLIPGDARCVSVLEAAMDVDSTPDRVIIWQAPDGRRPVLVVPSTTRQAQRLDHGEGFSFEPDQSSYGAECIADADGDGDNEVLLWDGFGANTGNGVVLDIDRGPGAPARFISGSNSYFDGRFNFYVGGAARHGDGYRLMGGGIFRNVGWFMHDDDQGFDWYEEDWRFVAGGTELEDSRTGAVRESDTDRLYGLARAWTGSGCPDGGSF